MNGWRNWIEKTHSKTFELRRHFFLRFFDSDLVSTPGQWRVVAGGILAVLLSFGTPFTQAYYHKYTELNSLPTGDPFRLSVLADALFVITLSMLLAGLLTTMQWPSLFPGLRDYLALAALPVRMRDLFIAKFTALAAFATVFIVSTNTLPSVILPGVMSAAPYGLHNFIQVPAFFVSSCLAAFFVVFTLIATQGLLLNLLPIRAFSGISLAAQGVLLMTFLCGLPLVFSVPNLYVFMDNRPLWAFYVPPLWFLGLHQAIAGNHEPFAIRLAFLAVGGCLGAAFAAILAYLWSYRRHRVRVLESPSVGEAPAREWFEQAARNVVRDPREFAVFVFVGKTLARSRQHRLVLTAFAALAIALVFESFVSVAVSHTFRNFSTSSPAVRQAVISAPLALSLFVLAGFRYLFRLPVELRANWIFRTVEAGNQKPLLTGVEKFLLWCGVGGVAITTLPFEIGMLGWRTGLAASVLCLVPSLALMEVLLMQFDKIPFTSSYLPGQQPVIQTLVIYGVAVLSYVTVLSGIIVWCIGHAGWAVALFAAMLAIWIRVRTGRLSNLEVGRLEFEERMEPPVYTLSIEKD